MNILYIAYSCSPYSGSEDKIGWKTPIEACKTNDVYVITKEEHRREISCYLEENPIPNIHFYYVDIPSVIKKVAKGFLYSLRLNPWHKKVYPLAEKICKEHGISVIHQITPMEVRAIGDYGRISNINYICGPIGGGEYVPDGLWTYTKKHRIVEYIRMAMNRLFMEKVKRDGRLTRCKLIYCNNETANYVGIEGPILTEIAVDNEIPSIQPIHKWPQDKFIFLWAGRMIYRKGVSFLLDAVERIDSNIPFEVRLIGDGPDMKGLKQRCQANDILRKHVNFVGKVAYAEMVYEYQCANVFVMPSLREAGGGVIAEALAYGLPMIVMNKFGESIVTNENNGWYFKGETQEDYIASLASQMTKCLSNPDEVLRKSKELFDSTKQYTWASKMDFYNTLYK